MDSGPQNRNRVKSVSFRGEPDINNISDNRQRNSFRDREEINSRDLDESRHVKLLPDANLTISVHNDYMDTRFRGSRGILKGNSFRDDTNLHYNNERNNQQSNRGFEAFRGRGRGKSRGFFQANNGGSYNQEYDNSKDNGQRNLRGRPLSGNYEQAYEHRSGHDYSNRGGRGRQGSESKDQEFDKGQEVQGGGGQTSGRGRQSQRHYNTDQYGQRDQQSQENFRGRSKSANDRPRGYRGGRGRGRGRGKTTTTSNGTDVPVAADGDKKVTDEDNEVKKEGEEVTGDRCEDSVPGDEGSSLGKEHSTDEVQSEVVADEAKVEVGDTTEVAKEQCPATSESGQETTAQTTTSPAEEVVVVATDTSDTTSSTTAPANTIDDK